MVWSIWVNPILANPFLCVMLCCGWCWCGLECLWCCGPWGVCGCGSCGVYCCLLVCVGGEVIVLDPSPPHPLPPDPFRRTPTGPPKISHFFVCLPPSVSFFSSLSGALLVEFWWFKRNWWWETEKKSAKFWAPHPPGPHPSGPDFSGFGPTLWAMTHTRSRNGLAKIGLAKIGQIRMAKKRLAKVGPFRTPTHRTASPERPVSISNLTHKPWYRRSVPKSTAVTSVPSGVCGTWPLLAVWNPRSRSKTLRPSVQ